jgi:hypothetical protein
MFAQDTLSLSDHVFGKQSMDVGVRGDMNRRLETVPMSVKQNLHVCNF